MTTSGTATFNPDFVEIAEEAFERAGLEMRTGYDLATARRSLNILSAEWSNRGLNMWTMEQGTQVLTANDASYDLPADTIDLIEHSIRVNAGSSATQADYPLSRISVSDYSAIPTKLDTGLPLQILITRTATPSITLWPIPDASQTYTLVYWRLRRIQDVGNPASNTIDIPSRFIPALIAGLAFHVAMKKPDAIMRVPALQAYYEQQLALAMDEDREKASARFTPYVGFV